MKTPVVYNQNYKVYFEHYNGHTFIHCDCFKWNKEIKKQLKKDVDTLVSIHGQPIIALHDKQDKKHYKFLKLMGFNFFQDIKCADSVIRELFIRRT